MATGVPLTLELPAAGPGTRREVRGYRFGEAGAGPKAYVQAAIHADEIPAMLVASHLLERVQAAEVEMSGELVIVPAANPVGLAQRLHLAHSGRYSFETGSNFNRSFPELASAVVARVTGQLTDDAEGNVATIRAALFDELDARPVRGETDTLKRWLFRQAADADYVLDLHCDHESPLYLYLGSESWPGGRDLAAYLGAQATLLALDSGGGSFDESHANLWWHLAQALPQFPIPQACFATTVELRGQADVSDELAAADAAGLFHFLTARGVIAGDAPPLPRLPREATPLTGVSICYAPYAGVVVYHRAIGEEVAMGDLIADLLDPVSQARTPLLAGTGGILLGRMRSRYAAAGEGVFKVAGEHPLEGRQDGDLLED